VEKSEKKNVIFTAGGRLHTKTEWTKTALSCFCLVQSGI